jgi:hypothetical protein
MPTRELHVVMMPSNSGANVDSTAAEAGGQHLQSTISRIGFKSDDLVAQNFFESLLKDSQYMQDVSMTKKLVPTDEKEAYRFEDFEQRFAKPAGFAIISRQPFPLNNKDEDWAKTITFNCGQANDKIKEEYKKFSTELRAKCHEKIHSKLSFHFLTQVKETGLNQVDSKDKCVNLGHVWELWTKGVPTKEMAKKVWEIFYGSVEADDELVMKKIQWETMMELKIWFSCENNNVNTKKKSDGNVKPRTSAIWQLTRNIIRDSFRNKYSRDSLVPHGIKIGVTKPGREKRSSRKKGKFVFEENVSNWDGDKHKKYLREKGITPGDEENNKMVANTDGNEKEQRCNEIAAVNPTGNRNSGISQANRKV